MQILSEHESTVAASMLRELSYILLAPLNANVVCWNSSRNIQVIDSLIASSSNKRVIAIDDCVQCYASSISQEWDDFVEVCVP